MYFWKGGGGDSGQPGNPSGYTLGLTSLLWTNIMAQWSVAQEDIGSINFLIPTPFFIFCADLADLDGISL